MEVEILGRKLTANSCSVLCFFFMYMLCHVLRVAQNTHNPPKKRTEILCVYVCLYRVQIFTETFTICQFLCWWQCYHNFHDFKVFPHSIAIAFATITTTVYMFLVHSTIFIFHLTFHEFQKFFNFYSVFILFLFVLSLFCLRVFLHFPTLFSVPCTLIILAMNFFRLFSASFLVLCFRKSINSFCKCILSLWLVLQKQHSINISFLPFVQRQASIKQRSRIIIQFIYYRYGDGGILCFCGYEFEKVES